MNRGGGRVEPTPPECALAAEMFDHFCSAGTMKQILALHREICNTLNLRPNRLPDFYPKLKAKLASSWKAQALFKKFDARANHKVYGKGQVCAQNKVLIIGAGPCGMRAAIECQLLGAKVVVIEKRDRISRNNVLHLWPFVIQDLRALGAKKFFGKFCAGSIDHISIRQLQCILLKVGLLLGVEFHEGVSFEELLEPTVTPNSESVGWRARVSPSSHPVSQYEFDSLVGADGKRNTLHGFKRKEFRGKLAMAITANFINRHSEQEASVPEISGVAFIFNQKFFKDLYEKTGIDLENIVYYKDDTHYFVMTAKKHSLLDKGVLLKDYAEVSRLLSVENVDRAALMRYAQEAARFSTEERLPLKEFALNHYGEPDVALFDFTSMYAAENASIVLERRGRRLLCQLVGDSLLEPFWPTGSGCARGFLSALDAAWAVRAWGYSPQPHPLHVIAERESIYRLLAQTTPENLHRDFGAYTLDPGTRYPNLNRTAVTPHRVTGFYDTDDPLPLDATPSIRKRRREVEVADEVLLSWAGVGGGGLRAAAAPGALGEAVRRYRPDLLPEGAPPAHLYHVLQHEFGITPPFSSNGNNSNGTLREVPDNKLRTYLSRVYLAFKGEVPHIHHTTDVFHQIKQNITSVKNARTMEHNVSAYSNAAETDKSHSSYKRKRRSTRTPQVSTDPADYIRKQIGKLDLNDITHLARLIEGHDALIESTNTEKQQNLQDQILALFDADESPDPAAVRDSLTHLLQGTSNTRVNKDNKLDNYFQDKKEKPQRPPRKLKGLDADSIRVLDFSDLDESADTDVTVVRKTNGSIRRQSTELGKLRSSQSPLKLRSSESPLRLRTAESYLKFRASESPLVSRRPSESPLVSSTRRPSDVIQQRIRHSASPEVRQRSHSTSGVTNIPEAVNTRRIVELFETRPQKRTEMRTPKPVPSSKMEERLRRVHDMNNKLCENKTDNSPDRARRSSIGVPELAMRRQRVVDLIKSGGKGRGSSTGRRRAARDITRQRFERSVALLAAERTPTQGAAGLDHDYGLQQYRASAPQFEDRVLKLERQLQHYEEGRIVGGGGRNAGGGVRVAKLAAELSSTTPTQPKANKPKDLMRSVGKIERDDWNMKEIERKIMENRLGRPEPRTAEKVPKWDREQFLGRQRKLKEGDGGDEKWGEIDETLHKLDQKLKDSGRPDHGTKKVANLATRFVKKDDPQPPKSQPKEEQKKSWRGPATAGVQCAACGTRVFAAEGVNADGLQLHRACFKCAVCKAVLRPGNYTMERYGSRLVCMRHSGVDVIDVTGTSARVDPTSTPERISVELSDSAAREIDEDEWTDRNCLASETSAAGAQGLSDSEESSSDEYTDAGESDVAPQRTPSPQHAAQHQHNNIYFSDDSFGYDDYSDDGGESSGGESCSRMRALREARRREVPAEARPPTDSSEVESEEESESSEEEVSSATEVSTDSEFARDECGLPAILVTPAPPPPPPPPPIITPRIIQTSHHPPEYPLARTLSAGGLATARALELKRRYLLGEPSPPTVRKSDSASQIDTKLATFTSNITEFQKMLNPATQAPARVPAYHATIQNKVNQPMPDIIKNLCTDAPVDLLAKTDIMKGYISEKSEPLSDSKKEEDVESDSLSESESSRTETAANQVPRVEVHDEGGELIPLDSLGTVCSIEDAPTASPSQPTTVVPVSRDDGDDSSRSASTLALTESDGSSWAGEGPALDVTTAPTDRARPPRALAGPKPIPGAGAKIDHSTHVCGRIEPEPVRYSTAAEHFAFADEGEPDLSEPVAPTNRGYMELIDDYEYSPSHDRSMDFIERSFSETVVRPETEPSYTEIVHTIPENVHDAYLDDEALSPTKTENDTSDKSSENRNVTDGDTNTESKPSVERSPSGPSEACSLEPSVPSEACSLEPSVESLSITEVSPQNVVSSKSSESVSMSPPLAVTSPTSGNSLGSTIRAYSPAICRVDVRVQELRRERDQQTEVVRRLVLARLGGPKGARQTRQTRRNVQNPARPQPPPSPTPPPPPPPPPALPVTPAFSDPELAREPRGKSIMKSISNYLNRHLGPRHKEGSTRCVNSAHKSTGALQEAPPVPPPPQGYCPPLHQPHHTPTRISASHDAHAHAHGDEHERDAMQLWFEARWARLVAQRRAREEAREPRDEPTARRLARLERRLSRPLSAEQQAATVAELVQVSAARDAHQALLKADRRRSAASGGD